MKELCIDIRMALSAGIGTYIRNIVPLLANAFKLRLIADERSIKKWPFLRPMRSHHNTDTYLLD